MTVVQVCARLCGPELVNEFIVRMNGTLSDERDSVHFRCPSLMDSVPVNGHRLRTHHVLHLDLYRVI